MGTRGQQLPTWVLHYLLLMPEYTPSCVSEWLSVKGTSALWSNWLASAVQAACVCEHWQVEVEWRIDSGVSHWGFGCWLCKQKQKERGRLRQRGEGMYESHSTIGPFPGEGEVFWGNLIQCTHTHTQKKIQLPKNYFLPTLQTCCFACRLREL